MRCIQSTFEHVCLYAHGVNKALNAVKPKQLQEPIFFFNSRTSTSVPGYIDYLKTSRDNFLFLEFDEPEHAKVFENLEARMQAVNVLPRNNPDNIQPEQWQ